MDTMDTTVENSIWQSRTFKWILLLGFSFMIFAFKINEGGIYSAQEGRAGIITRNMYKSHNWLNLYIKGDDTTQKPILCYWLYAVSCKIFGLNETGVRIPSVLAAIICVVFICLLGGRMYGEDTGFLAGFILASMAYFANLGRIARIDMVLAAFYAVSMYLLYTGYIEKRKSNWRIFLFYIVLGVSVLAKGPVTVALAGITVVLFAIKERDWKVFWEIRPISGMLIGAVLTVPWYVYESMKTHGEFAVKFLWYHNVERFLGLEATYGGGKRKSFLFYVPNMLLGTLPWSVFIPFALYSFRRKLLKLTNKTYFLLFWFIPVFVFFSIAFVKRGDYILPLYPALALLIARYIFWARENTKLTKITKYWVILWVALLVVALSALFAFYFGLAEYIGNRVLTKGLSHISHRDAMSLLQFDELVKSNFTVALLAIACLAAILFFCGRFFHRGKLVEGAFSIALVFLVAHTAFLIWVAPFQDKFRSVKGFSLACASHIPKDEKCVFFRTWDLENVFFVNRDYEKIWPTNELTDEKGKLKYRHIIFSQKAFDCHGDFIKHHKLKVLEKTIDGHQYPMVFCSKE